MRIKRAASKNSKASVHCNRVMGLKQCCNNPQVSPSFPKLLNPCTIPRSEFEPHGDASPLEA